MSYLLIYLLTSVLSSYPSTQLGSLPDGYPGTFGYYSGPPGNTTVADWRVHGHPLTVHGRQRAY